MSTVNIAVNANTLNKVWSDLKAKINAMPPLTTAGNLGPFGASFAIGFQISNAPNPIQLTNNGVEINNLEITYTPLRLTLTVTIHEIDTPKICEHLPLIGYVCLPTVELFPQTIVSLPIDLSGLFAGSFSGKFNLTPFKQVLAAKGALTPHQASLTADTTDEILNDFKSLISSAIPILPGALVNDIAKVFVPRVKGNLSDKWLFHLKDVYTNLQLIDLGDTAINILDIITDKLLSFLPGSIRSIAEAILRPFINTIGAALDLGNDVLTWLEKLFQTSLGIGNMLETFIGNLIFQMWPVFKFDDPFPMLAAGNGLIAVLVPVENVAVTVNAPQELLISTNLM